jgi:uncharacterized protein YbaA (DUF1428 family)
MGKYIDGYVVPIQKRNLPAYRRLAQVASKVWMDHGALAYHETVGDDLDVHCGMPFPRALKLKRGETVLFSYVVYRSRKHRDRVNQLVMTDKRLAAMMQKQKMPFDMSRMLFAGFKSLVEG